MIINIDKSKAEGKVKILNATNGGPWHKRHATDQYRSNLDAYKAAKIPYARNHDCAVNTIYGGPYSHDITAIFPNFDADVSDPASYDFACTDESILCALDAGTETFFRLGQTIEHQIKKHGTIPPKDFNKWAEICEHIILHYNYGWANGFELGIKYWEIWNEPDLDTDTSPNKRTWGGTTEMFFDLFEITAKKLKTRFPELKIGGPALAGRWDWAEKFLSEMQKREVPLDFFSWHIYSCTPVRFAEKSLLIHDLLQKYGYSHAESILNEWNYVKNWTDQFVYTIKSIHGLKGAAFTMACISVAAHSPIDMLMYYDTRPSAFCGAFDFYTFEKLKGYYPLYWYGMFYEGYHMIENESTIENVYTLCGVNEKNKALAIITYFSDDDNAEDKQISIDFGESGKYEVFYLDNEHDPEQGYLTENLTFNMKVHNCILIKEL